MLNVRTLVGVPRDRKQRDRPLALLDRLGAPTQVRQRESQQRMARRVVRGRFDLCCDPRQRLHGVVPSAAEISAPRLLVRERDCPGAPVAGECVRAEVEQALGVA